MVFQEPNVDGCRVVFVSGLEILNVDIWRVKKRPLRSLMWTDGMQFSMSLPLG